MSPIASIRSARPMTGVSMVRHPRRLVAVLAVIGAAAALAVPITLGASVGAGAGIRAQKCPLQALDEGIEAGRDHVLALDARGPTRRRSSSSPTSSTPRSPRSRSTLVNQTTYKDTLTKYVAGLSTGDLPDLVQIEDTGLQQMIDTQSILPAPGVREGRQVRHVGLRQARDRLLHRRRDAVADAVQRLEPGLLLQQEGVHRRPASTRTSRRRRSTRSRPTRRSSSTAAQCRRPATGSRPTRGTSSSGSPRPATRT